MNKKTLALTAQQYDDIIKMLRSGFCGCRPNHRVATVLVCEANLGLRISDVLSLRLADIVLDGGRYRLDITEQKTGKQRNFTVPVEIYNYIRIYCLENGIKPHEKIFQIGQRAVQKQLKLVSDHLQISGISTHSFRKFFATQIYEESGYNILLVRALLQHSSPTVTQKYIGVQQKDIEDALRHHICLK